MRSVRSPHLRPRPPTLVHFCPDQDSKSLIGAFSLRHTLDLKSQPLILPSISVPSGILISTTARRAFLTCSTEGRRPYQSRCRRDPEWPESRPSRRVLFLPPEFNRL